MSLEAESILRFNRVEVTYMTEERSTVAVRGVSLSLQKGMVLGIVGESGCGKSTLAMATLNLIMPPGRVTGGSIQYSGNGLEMHILEMQPRDVRRYRWQEVAMVFQGSLNSLNPVLRIEDQIIDVMVDHDVPLQNAKKRVVPLLSMVGLQKGVMSMFPHELSGGMKQRVNMAIALACNPKVLIADEPTTALDVVMQGQIIKKLRGLKKELGLSMIFITHDISLVSTVADEIAVMYAGRIVELASAKALVRTPKHPYTVALIGSIPSLKTEGKVSGIPGYPPDLSKSVIGCPYADRCGFTMEICRREEPELVRLADGRKIACHLFKEKG